MSRLRYQALKALGDALEAAVPALLGKVFTLSAEPESWADYPGLAIIPRGRFTYQPQQEDEVDQEEDPVSGPPISDLVVNVGRFLGQVELRLTTINAPTRELLEDAIANVFLSPEGSPGVYVVEVPSVTIAGNTTLYAAPCAFTLEEGEWRDEQVFEKRRFTWLEVEATLPVLVVRSVATIERLYADITHDLESDDPVIDYEAEINEDGEVI